MATPGTAAPDESLTAPWIDASPCAKLEIARLAESASVKNPSSKTFPE
jgi:hypothetical protein